MLVASRIVDPDTEFDVIVAWLAQYAKLRNWGTKAQIKKQEAAIRPYQNTKPADIQKDIKKLLKNHRFVVLQGAHAHACQFAYFVYGHHDCSLPSKSMVSFPCNHSINYYAT